MNSNRFGVEQPGTRTSTTPSSGTDIAGGDVEQGPSHPLPYGRQCLDDEDVKAVLDVLRGDWLTQGPHVDAFERALADCCGARYAVAVSSGTAALHLACMVTGLGPGDVGITSPITFVASANCVAYCGAVPTFVDIDLQTITMDPAALEDTCSRRPPKVIIPVDFAGQPADLPAVYEIAKRHGSVVIEDAAHSLGASYEDASRWHRSGSCAHSDMAILSFHPVKHITTGEGGAILTNSIELYDRLRRLRSHGIARDSAMRMGNDGPWYYEQRELGFNYRITDIQCGLGLSQLRKLPRFVERRRHLVELYRTLLTGVESEVTLLLESAGRHSAYHLLVAQITGSATRRRRVFEILQSRGIQAQVHYIPVHLQPWYRERYGFCPGDYPRAEAYYAGCLSLPLFPGMTSADVERVAGVLRAALVETSGVSENA